MDGVNITDMGATGSSPLYFDFDSFEELQITTGGSDPRIETPGVQLNLVTKRGTNDFRGTARYFYTPGSLQAESTVPGEATGYLATANRINFVRDYGAELGGPIWKDKFWFWAARGDQKISVQVASTIGANATVSAGAFDNIVLRNKNLKLNGQLLANNSAVGFYTFGDKVRNARDLSPTRPFETAYRQTGPTKVYKLEDTHIFGSSLYLTGMWSKVDGGFSLVANGGEGESAKSRWRDAAGVNHDGYFSYHTLRPQKQYRLDGSKFFDIGKMNHELKFGFGYRNTPVHSTSSLPGSSHGWLDYSVTGNSATLCATQGLPSGCFTATIPRDADSAYGEKYNDFYVGDTVLMGNLTLQAGLRWDRQKSLNQGSAIAANPVLATPLALPCISSVCSGTLNAFLPAVNYTGDSRDLKWNTVAPRIGATYTLGADKRTLIRAGYNRYVSQQGSLVSGANPLAYSAFYFYGFDANGDHTVQRSELLKIRGFTGVDPSNPSGVAVTRRVDYGMKVPTSDEFLVGGERELMTDFSVGLNYTYRKYHNLTQTRFEKTQGAGDYYTRADYVPATKNGVPVIAGGTFTLKDPITGAVITTFTTPTRPVWALSPSVALPSYRVLTTRPDYSQKFSGLELTTTKRMSHNWMFRANASWNNYTESCGANAVANPTQVIGSCPGGEVAPQSGGSGAFGGAFINAKWEFNVTGVYVAPWDINVGANLSARQGYPAPLRDNVTGLRGGTLAVVLDNYGTTRFDNVYELDLRVAKDFRFFNRVGMTVSGDLFNVPNKRTILQRNSIVLQNEASLSSGWRITELQTPRIWRLGARFNF